MTVVKSTVEWKFVITRKDRFIIYLLSERGPDFRSESKSNDKDGTDESCIQMGNLMHTWIFWGEFATIQELSRHVSVLEIEK